jgi:hypothetical protein
MPGQADEDLFQRSATASIAGIVLGGIAVIVCAAILFNWRGINDKYVDWIDAWIPRPHREMPEERRRKDINQQRAIFTVTGLLALGIFVGGVVTLVRYHL